MTKTLFHAGGKLICNGKTIEFLRDVELGDVRCRADILIDGREPNDCDMAPPDLILEEIARARHLDD